MFCNDSVIEESAVAFGGKLRNMNASIYELMWNELERWPPGFKTNNTILYQIPKYG